MATHAHCGPVGLCARGSVIINKEHFLFIYLYFILFFPLFFAFASDSGRKYLIGFNTGIECNTVLHHSLFCHHS